MNVRRKLALIDESFSTGVPTEAKEMSILYNGVYQYLKLCDLINATGPRETVWRMHATFLESPMLVSVRILHQSYHKL